jgi:hypothetical protein
MERKQEENKTEKEQGRKDILEEKERNEEQENDTEKEWKAYSYKVKGKKDRWQGESQKK